ncbi:MAG: hypothetical protein QG673_1788 [Pseudomonadota bacterium]|nr:hypothetical protein [Pseudomonadota bacterium]
MVFLLASAMLRDLNLVLEWLDLHKQELLEDWELAQNQKPLKLIKPLE